MLRDPLIKGLYTYFIPLYFGSIKFYISKYASRSQCLRQPSCIPIKILGCITGAGVSLSLGITGILLRRAHFLLIAGWKANSTSEPTPQLPHHLPPSGSHPLPTVSFNQSSIMESELNEL